jgi:hypothetical protein
MILTNIKEVFILERIVTVIIEMQD